MMDAPPTIGLKSNIGAAAPVLVRREGPIAYITFNRPNAVNSVDAPFARAFRSIIAALDADPAVRALVIEGSGRVFCAGGDLATFAREGEDAPRYVEGLIADLHEALAQLSRFHAPVIASVHGAAAGAGLGIALAADIVVADQGSRFLMAYTRSGLTPDGGTSWSLPRAVGLRQAIALTFLNRTLTAQDALEAGLITEVVAEEKRIARVKALALELAAGPTAAFATARRLLREASSNSYSEQLAAESRSIVHSFGTEDGREGVRAFAERRLAQFNGT